MNDQGLPPAFGDPSAFVIDDEVAIALPPSIQLRKDDAALDERLDEMASEGEVRREVDEFNQRVIHARYGLPAGPPLITMPRDVEATVAAWADRRARRAAKAREQAHVESPEAARRPRRLLRKRARKRR